jgi:hypothetical protein
MYPGEVKTHNHRNLDVNVHSIISPTKLKSGNNPNAQQLLDEQTQYGLSINGLLSTHKKEEGPDSGFSMSG